MRSKGVRKIIAIAAVCCMTLLLVCPAGAYFDRGTVGLSLGSSSVTLYEGESQTVSVSFSPSSSDQTEGCGMEECPRICGEKGCLDENGECTCAGPEYTTYYASADVSSSNASVASASYSNGTVSIYAGREGTATIEVTSELRQFSSSTKTIQVTVKEKKQAAESPAEASGGSGTDNHTGSSSQTGGSEQSAVGNKNQNSGGTKASTGSGSKSSGKGSAHASAGRTDTLGNSNQTVSSAAVTESGTIVSEGTDTNGSSNVTDITVSDNAEKEENVKVQTDENSSQADAAGLLSEDVVEAGRTADNKAGETASSHSGDRTDTLTESGASGTYGNGKAAAGVIIAAAAVAAACTGILLRKKKMPEETGNRND